jgi:hypothetical protein
MPDRRTTLLMERLRAIAARKERFCYDVRGDSHVDRDIIAAYRITTPAGQIPELEVVVQHALDHDAIVMGFKDPADGRTHYSSCRLFTDMLNAVRFARENGQRSVYNWNRSAEVLVDDDASGGAQVHKGHHSS